MMYDESMPKPPTPTTIDEAFVTHDQAVRQIAIWQKVRTDSVLAARQLGATQAQIAEHLGVTQSAVSTYLKRHEGETP